jgi:PhnB protein
MMQVYPHLCFRGECEAAFTFYERLTGGKVVTMLKFGDSPALEQVPPEWREKIVHASLSLTGSTLSGADVLPEQYVKPQGFFVLLNVADMAYADRVFRGLADGGSVRVPIHKTFWSAGFGVLVDRFGIPWEVSCGRAPERG